MRDGICAADAAREQLADASPLVRGAAVWALSRLLPAGEFAVTRAQHMPRETDSDVRAEWTANETPDRGAR